MIDNSPPVTVGDVDTRLPTLSPIERILTEVSATRAEMLGLAAAFTGLRELLMGGTAQAAASIPARPAAAALLNPIRDAPDPTLADVLAWPDCVGSVTTDGARILARGVEPIEGRPMPQPLLEDGRTILRYQGRHGYAAGAAIRAMLGEERRITIVQAVRARGGLGAGTGGMHAPRIVAKAGAHTVLHLRHQNWDSQDLALILGDGRGGVRTLCADQSAPAKERWRLIATDVQRSDSASGVYPDDAVDILRDDTPAARSTNPKACRSVQDAAWPVGVPRDPCTVTAMHFGQNVPADGSGFFGDEFCTLVFRALDPLRRIQAVRAVAAAAGLLDLAPPRPRVVDVSRMTPTLVEDFNRLDASPDGKGRRWVTSLNGGRTLSGNREQQFYGDASTGHPDTLRAEGGELVIRARRATGLPANPTPFTHVSGAITSTGSEGFAQFRGYFEWERRTPVGVALWPAFWLLNRKGGWPPELDVEEVVGHMPDLAAFNTHSMPGARDKQPRLYPAPPGADGYARVGALWGEERIAFTVNGMVVREVPTPADFTEPMFVLLNMAVGGNMPGPVTAQTPAEAELRVRSVKVWQFRRVEA